MAQQDVIREFLVKLGFKIDEAGQRKFADSVGKMTDRVVELGKAAAVMATAVAVAVVKVADNLDNLYFASKRIGAGAGNIKAFEYAIKQMGGSGESARAALEGLARFMRNSPGAESWIGGLGVKTRDANGNLRDTVDIYSDLASVLKGMDSSQSNAVAQVLGLDDTTLQAIRSGDMAKYMAEYKDNLKAAGLDMDKATKQAHDFEEANRRLMMKVEGLGYAIGSQLLPYLVAFNRELERLLPISEKIEKVLTRISTGKTADFFQNIAWVLNSLGVIPNFDAAKLTPEAQSRSGRTWIGRIVDEVTGSSAPAGKKSDPSAMFSSLERQFGLPAGILDRMWSKESGRGRNLIGPMTRTGERALGHFQFMSDTARQYGLSDPGNLEQSAGAAARYLHDLMGAFGGDINQAVAAYNWGPGNVLRNGLGSMPSETRNYVRDVVPIQQANTTTINVTGSGDAMATAQAVAGMQVQVAQSQARNMRGAMQ